MRAREEDVQEIRGVSSSDSVLLRGRVYGNEDEVGLNDGLVDIGREEEVLAAVREDDLLESRLEDGELVRIPRGDTRSVNIDDGDLDVRALVRDHGACWRGGIVSASTRTRRGGFRRCVDSAVLPGCTEGAPESGVQRGRRTSEQLSSAPARSSTREVPTATARPTATPPLRTLARIQRARQALYVLRIAPRREATLSSRQAPFFRAARYPAPDELARLPRLQRSRLSMQEGESRVASVHL